MLKPTIGPNWHNHELQLLSDKLKKITREVNDPKTDFTPKQLQEKREIGRALYKKWKPIADNHMEVDRIRAEVKAPENASLAIEQKLEKLDLAKIIATDLPTRYLFDQVINDQITLMLSSQAAMLPASRQLEIDTVLLIESGSCFTEPRVGEARGGLQDAMLQLASTHLLPQDPATAFKTGQIIAETAEGDPARQIAGVDLMFAALKQEYEASSEGNAAALLLSTQPRWGVQLASKIVQDFVDVQLSSLRAGTGLIEYSDRNTKAVPTAIDTLRATTPIVAAERLGIEFSL